jgi:hypothetical protein
MRERDWICLASLMQRLAVARRMEDLAKVVIGETRRLLSADGVSFVLRDDESCYYLDEDAVSPLWRGLKFPMTACISGWSMLNMQTAVISDIYDDARIPHDVYRPTFVKSMVMTPIGVPEPLGAMGVYWSDQRECDSKSLAVIEAIAGAAASAITSVHLYTFLLHAEQKLAIAHEIGSLGSYQLNASTLRLSASPSMKQIFGERADAELGYDQFVNATSNRDRNRLLSAITSAVEFGRPFSIDCQISHRDNSVHDVRILGRASYGSHDPDVSVMGVVRYIRAVTPVGR